MRKRLLTGVLVVAAVLVAARWLPLERLVPGRDAGPAPSAYAASSPASPDPDQRFAALPSRAPLGAPRGALFAAPQAQKPAAAPPSEAPKPSAPPMPYRVAGKLTHDGVAKIVLARGDRVLTVEQGDTLEGGYRVDAIGAEEITLVYEPLGVRERLPLAANIQPATPGAPASAGGSIAAAQLRWDGPERIKSGSVFNLALKLTSSEPLRAAPLRLNYDPRQLEPVSVRPGKFFGGDASFSYRIDPSGSIVVAASGNAAAASDAELLIVSFKPLAAASAAEVRLAAVQLQRNAGAPIPAEPLEAFRAAIAP